MQDVPLLSPPQGATGELLSNFSLTQRGPQPPVTSCVHTDFCTHVSAVLAPPRGWAARGPPPVREGVRAPGPAAQRPPAPPLPLTIPLSGFLQEQKSHLLQTKSRQERRKKDHNLEATPSHAPVKLHEPRKGALEGPWEENMRS